MITNARSLITLLPLSNFCGIASVTRLARRVSLLLAAVLSLSTVHATVIVVQSSADGVADAANCPGAGGTCRLRDALAKAVDGDVIQFSVGTITLTNGELLVDDSITILGNPSGGSVVDGNHASRVFHIAQSKTVSINGLTIRNGDTTGVSPPSRGGGIYNDHDATLSVVNSTVSGNSASLFGGGIYNDHATLTVTNSTLNSNSAGAQGGGIFNDGSLGGSATLTISNSTLSSNSAGEQGGGIFNEAFDVTSQGGSATVTINNSTLSGNSASGAGGGIYADGFHGSVTLNLHNSTLSGNSAPQGGGGIFNVGHAASATIHIGNTILNQGGFGENIRNEEFGLVQSDGYNLSSDAGVTNGNGGTGSLSSITNDKINTDPMLAPLGDNGGLTMTHALLIGSPAIDAGKNLGGTVKDQRGRTRPNDDASITNATGGDGSDIGAFELYTLQVRDSGDGVATPGNCPGVGCRLRDALAAVSPGDGIYFYPPINVITLMNGELLVSKSVDISGPGAANLTVSGNATSRVFHIGAGKTVTVSGLTIHDGVMANNFGGGIYNDHATLTLRDSVVTGNYASNGGGITNDAAGGSASLTIINSTLSYNSTTDAITGSGGGILNFGNAGSAILVISNSTLSGNSAPFGGGIYSSSNSGSASVTIDNSTLSGNLAPTRAGGIMNDGSSSGNAVLALTNCTLSGNSSPSGASIANDATSSGIATVKLGNTILQAKALEANITNAAGVVTSNGYNLSSDGGITNTSGGTGSLSATGDQTGKDPMLAPLGDNGGPTMTHALLIGSPAVDAGNATGTDQRGRARPFNDPTRADVANGSDIGAFELYTVKVTNNKDDNSAETLRKALSDALPGDGIYFDAALDGQAITLTSGELLVDKSVDIAGPGADKLQVDGNSASRVFNIQGGIEVAISGLTIAHGSADNAAGINNQGSRLTLSNSALSANSSSTYGGGVMSGGSGAELHVLNCTISNNAANDGYGGGVFIAGGTAEILDSTFSGNSAISEGGGIMNVGDLTIVNSTFSLNSATGSGGAILNGGTLHIGNTILNTGGVSGENIYNRDGTVVSDGHNLSNDGGVTNNGSGLGSLNAAGDHTNVPDLKLGPLTDNGGPTLTHALLAGSPALDAGDNTLAFNVGLTTDERGSGFSRILDAASDADTTQTVDIGAFEADPSVEDISDKSTPEDTPLSFTFKVGDSATPFDSDSVTASSSNTTLVPNDNIVVDFDTDSTRKLTLTPAANLSGTTTITVTVKKIINGAAVSMSDTFVFTVTAVNDAPVADSQSLFTDQGTDISITLTGSDVDGDTLTFSVVSDPAHGTLTGTAPNLTYHPDANYKGGDSFTFKVNDGQADSNTATVSIAVGNHPPVADDQAITTKENIAKAITLTGSDTDGGTLTFSIVTGPSHGTLTGTAPNLTYMPAANYDGTDSFTFKASDGISDSDPATVSITVVGPASHPLNISTRLNVLTGENVLIGGFYITGSAPKKVIVRAIGPSLNINGTPIDGRLGDTVLELFDQTTLQKIATNDNWKVDDATGQSQEATIVETTVPPPDDLESALVVTLNPGPYTAKLSGKDGLTGIALVEVYDLDQAADSKFANISTRGFVAGADNVMIGGFILGASEGGSEILVRGIGPSLTGSGVANALPDPRVEIHSENGTLLGSNDNWKTDDQSGQSQEAAITATTIPPTNEAESALLVTLPPGAYTAILGGNGAATGVALIEVYNLQ